MTTPTMTAPTEDYTGECPDCGQTALIDAGFGGCGECIEAHNERCWAQDRAERAAECAPATELALTDCDGCARPMYIRESSTYSYTIAICACCNGGVSAVNDPARFASHY